MGAISQVRPPLVIPIGATEINTRNAKFHGDTCALHASGGLHPRGRAPRRGEQLEGVPRDGLRALDHRQQGLMVAGDGKCLQRVVAGLLAIRVVAQREIAAGDVRAAKRVARRRRSARLLRPRWVALRAVSRRLPTCAA